VGGGTQQRQKTLVRENGQVKSNENRESAILLAKKVKNRTQEDIRQRERRKRGARLRTLHGALQPVVLGQFGSDIKERKRGRKKRGR